MSKPGMRCSGDIDLFQKLVEDPKVIAAREEAAKNTHSDARRHLLSTAVRLTPAMAPSICKMGERCRDTLDIESPLEIYVAPSPSFNAFSYGAHGGRVVVGFTSALLEGFDEDELAFVMGHELGHYLFNHHDIPIHLLIRGDQALRPPQALRLFSWQRYAEISADRAGLVCVGKLAPTERAFFKLASGLTSKTVAFDIQAYLKQIGDIQSESDAARKGEMRADWFSSHPFSPLRVRATQLCSESEVCKDGGESLELLEQKVSGLMSLMEPGYLADKSTSGEAMRRLLLAAGMTLASCHGGISEEEVEALETFLGEGRIGNVSASALQADLASRVEFANETVSALKRGQVLRDLCVVARADNNIAEGEKQFLRELALNLDVDPTLIDQTLATTAAPLD